MADTDQTVFQKLYDTIEARKNASPAESYVAGLLEKGTVKINAKIMEEAGEVCEAGLTDDKPHLVHEIADLFFHTFVLASFKNITLNDIEAELSRRMGKSGLVEKRERNNSQQETQ
jgi:phosphoribosyl-ATP pyrophosphohydrolase